MTNEIHQTQAAEHQPVPFGTRLQSAREALGIERKDAAAQLRLNEKVIVMMEKERYPTDLPVTFIRGYIRSYGKLLQIPEHEIKQAIEPIKPQPTQQVNPVGIAKTPTAPVTSGNYFMQMFTYLIVFTLLGLVGMWWYSNTPPAVINMVENQTNPTVENNENNQSVISIESPVPTFENRLDAATTTSPPAPTLGIKPATPNQTNKTVVTAPSKPAAKQTLAANAEEDESDQSETNTNSDNNSDNNDTSSDDAE